AKVLDPTCGDGVFLRAAGRVLRTLAGSDLELEKQVYGVDLHEESLAAAKQALREEGLDAHLAANDFFALPPPSDLFRPLPAFDFDAVVGNPPFVRYQRHTGDARRLSLLAALRNGVRLSGLTSSWAPSLVHAGAFLAPGGRLAMVLPAELLTVGYAEPIRRWLRERFASVQLVMFERLQFEDALKDVVLLLAHGVGECDAFALYHVRDAEELARYQTFDGFPVALNEHGKWTDLLLTVRQRQVFRRIAKRSFVPLGSYGSPELGTVTGANGFFALSEETRREYGLIEERHVKPISPPGTRHLRGFLFTHRQWEELRDQGGAVWILYPEPDDGAEGLRRYIARGEQNGIHSAYRCRVRTPWWRPPLVTPPDLFFTYMSHHYPRLIANQARVSFVNSMHGIRLRKGAPQIAQDALPLLSMNSVTMLGAEVFGRSYGGGVLKMEPREAATLPIPGPDELERGWRLLRPQRARLERQLQDGQWAEVVARVDDVLLNSVLRLSGEDASALCDAAVSLRARRLGRSVAEDSEGYLVATGDRS
ncbi:MAG: N-6 DNA methylase, partial [Chloroflexi bacterium]|nr:N-6 DNA methylase [Chloroflexota bacterium]